jgi:hypothetical protein
MEPNAQGLNLFSGGTEDFLMLDKKAILVLDLLRGGARRGRSTF